MNYVRMHPDIAAAIGRLNAAEAGMPSDASANEYFDVLDDLNDLAENGDLDDEAKIFVSNLKLAHARRILTRLAEFESADMSIGAPYVIVLHLRLQSELEALLEEHPEFRQSYESQRRKHANYIRDSIENL